MLTEIGTVFSEVIKWVGEFVTSLIGETGALNELLPLLFIGVGISILMVSVRIVRKIMWSN